MTPQIDVDADEMKTKSMMHTSIHHLHQYNSEWTNA